jgi:hypothetical protein
MRHLNAPGSPEAQLPRWGTHVVESRHTKVDAMWRSAQGPGQLPPVPSLGRILAAVGLCLLVPAVLASAQEQDADAATGLSASRAYLRVLPWESIDIYSGGLTLTFTDIVLPGNAGFDLRISRVYNRKGGGRWRIGPGYINDSDSWSNANPTIVTDDGGERLTFQDSGDSSIYRTLGYGQYHRPSEAGVSPSLYLPDGTVYEYNCLWRPPSNSSRSARYPTLIGDPLRGLHDDKSRP